MSFRTTKELKVTPEYKAEFVNFASINENSVAARKFTKLFKFKKTLFFVGKELYIS